MITLSKRAEMGMGTLILFIAILLISAVAAGVLIVTGNALQSKSLITGSEVEKDITTHALFVSVSGQDGSDGYIENLTAFMRLAAGSQPVDLAISSLTILLDNGTGSYVGSPNVSSTSTFMYTFLSNGTEHLNGFLTRGDLVQIDFVAPRVLSEGERVKLRFRPPGGTISVTTFKTPQSISRQTINLYP